jgi:hypothetical protein
MPLLSPSLVCNKSCNIYATNLVDLDDIAVRHGSSLDDRNKHIPGKMRSTLTMQLDIEYHGATR